MSMDDRTIMNSILLTGLLQRLLIAMVAWIWIWGIYFWAISA